MGTSQSVVTVPRSSGACVWTSSGKVLSEVMTVSFGRRISVDRRGHRSGRGLGHGSCSVCVMQTVHSFTLDPESRPNWWLVLGLIEYGKMSS